MYIFTCLYVYMEKRNGFSGGDIAKIDFFLSSPYYLIDLVI